MKTKLLGIIAIAIIALAIIGCKEDEPPPPPPPIPQPTQQSYLIDLAANGGTSTAKVTVIYMALPGVVPGYMGNLKTAILGAIKNSSKTGNLTVNVISGSNANPSVVSEKLTIGESWLTGKSSDDIELGLPALGSWTS